MSRCAGWVALACAWAACVPSTEHPIPSGGRSFLEVALDGAGDVVSVTGLAALGPRAVISGVGTRYVLRYDVPLEDLGITPDAAGRVAVAARDADTVAAWSIPAPAAWSVLGPDELAFSTEPLPPALLAVQLARPPCPTLVQRAVPLPADVDVVGLAELGDRVIVSGLLPGPEPYRRPPALWTVEALAEAAVEAPTPEALPSAVATRPPPLLFHEGAALRVLWGSNAGGLVRSFAITSTLGFVDARRLVQADARPLRPDALAAFEDGGRVTTIYHAFEHEVYASRSATAAFVRIARESEAGDECQLGTYTQVLELSSGRAGLVGMLGSSVWVVDLDAPVQFVAPYGPKDMGRVCRSARAVGPYGELLAWQALARDILSEGEAQVAWRPSDEAPWVRLAGVGGTNGACAVAMGGLYFVCSKVGGELAVFEYDRRRPELPPRACGSVRLRNMVAHLLATPAGVVAGGRAGLTWLVRPADDAARD